MAASEPPPPKPPTKTPTLDDASILELFLELESRATAIVKIPAGTPVPEGNQFGSTIPVDRIARLRVLLGNVHDRYHKNVLLSFVCGVATGPSLVTQLGSIMESWKSKKKPVIIPRLAIAAIINPPKCPHDVEKLLGGDLPQKVVAIFERMSANIDWDTRDRTAQNSWGAYWDGPNAAPKYKVRADHVYRVLCEEWAAKVTADPQFVAKFTYPQCTDFPFYTMSDGGKMFTRITAPKGGVNDTETVLAQDDPETAFIRRKVVPHGQNAKTTLRGENAIYCAMFEAFDVPDIYPAQMYIGMASNGTFDRWCIASDCHLAGAIEVINDIKQGGRKVRPNHQLVDMMIAWHWIRTRSLREFRVVVIRHTTDKPGDLEKQEIELYMSPQYKTTDQRFGTNDFRKAKKTTPDAPSTPK